MVRPLIEYFSPVWAACMKIDKELLERIQHRFTIPCLRQIPYKKRLCSLTLWSLEEQGNRADLIEVFKSSRNLNGIDFLSLFQMSSSTHLRRHSLKFKKKQSRLIVRRYFFAGTVCRKILFSHPHWILLIRDIRNSMNQRMVSLWTKNPNNHSKAIWNGPRQQPVAEPLRPRTWLLRPLPKTWLRVKGQAFCSWFQAHDMTTAWTINLGYWPD